MFVWSGLPLGAASTVRVLSRHSLSVAMMPTQVDKDRPVNSASRRKKQRMDSIP